jgi:phage tail sheath protein FI
MIERVAPGVFVTEVEFRAKSIEGVPTSTGGFTGPAEYAQAQVPSNPAPAWTDANQSDPGVTLLELFAWIGDSLAYRADLDPRAAFGAGIVSGLDVEADDDAASINVTPGQAIGSEGRPVDTHADSRQRVIDPD